ncbi:serine hydrolase domain-containing protein [Paenibacillus sp. M1]|uniref:Serine hydrolase domain-containing protein n=1 Tax=Paenibacillus haidiansis TaxID=1574488 RepID=A0ABU7VNR0_9BACL
MFNLEAATGKSFNALNNYVSEVKNKNSATAAATFIIHNDRIVNEWYSGVHDNFLESRLVDEESRFNVASVRKTFLGFATSLALHQGKIRSIDDLVVDYLNDLDREVLNHTTIRHLLTHTHGLESLDRRLFLQGTDWKYNNVGVNLLIEIIRKLYKMPLAQLIEECIFSPTGFNQTGWCKDQNNKLVWLNEQYKDDQGSEANLFISTRELAYWGYLHLNKGAINGKQLLAKEIFEQTTSIISLSELKPELPRNGFFWFIQDEPRSLTELGNKLPSGSFQSLGATGCACLVIPKYKTVAVRMYNQNGSNPEGYDYLDDIKTFGNLVCKCVEDQ